MKYVAVLSGKGGVGKTTTIVGVALALKAMGLNPAILDLDLENPSMGGRWGVTGFTRANVSFLGDLIKPPEWCGIPVMSVSLLPMVNYEDTPTMVDEATKHWLIRQLIKEVDWGESDIIMVDMPPGTGEEVRGLLQLGDDLAGGLIVTAPQSISEVAVRKVIVMAQEYGIRLLGIIENEVNAIPGFAGHNLADAFKLPLLARVRWDRDIPLMMEDHKPFDHVPFLEVAEEIVNSVMVHAPVFGFEREISQETGVLAVAVEADGEVEPGPSAELGMVTLPVEAAGGFAEMSDGVWAEIQPLMPVPATARQANPRADDRKVVNGILWYYTTAIAWKKMPPYICKWQTALARVKRWRADGTWETVWKKAQELGYKPAEEESGNTTEDGDPGMVRDGSGASESSGVGGEGEAEVPVGSTAEC